MRQRQSPGSRLLATCHPPAWVPDAREASKTRKPPTFPAGARVSLRTWVSAHPQMPCLRQKAARTAAAGQMREHGAGRCRICARVSMTSKSPAIPAIQNSRRRPAASGADAAARQSALRRSSPRCASALFNSPNALAACSPLRTLSRRRTRAFSAGSLSRIAQRRAKICASCRLLIGIALGRAAGRHRIAARRDETWAAPKYRDRSGDSAPALRTRCHCTPCGAEQQKRIPATHEHHRANMFCAPYRLRNGMSAWCGGPKRQFKAAGPSIQLHRFRPEPIRVSVALAPRHIGGKE